MDVFFKKKRRERERKLNTSYPYENHLKKANVELDSIEELFSGLKACYNFLIKFNLFLDEIFD